MSTILPLTWPLMIARCAAAASVSGNSCATKTRSPSPWASRVSSSRAASRISVPGSAPGAPPSTLMPAPGPRANPAMVAIRVSDWIGDVACLLRIDPVHHKLAVFQGDGPGLCHLNFQVASIDDVFRNWHFLVDHGVEIEMGPGRHPQSTAIFLYFLGPEGFTYEYSFGVRRIEDDAAWVPRTLIAAVRWSGCFLSAPAPSYD